jgi:hypothetical protein
MSLGKELTYYCRSCGKASKKAPKIIRVFASPDDERYFSMSFLGFSWNLSRLPDVAGSLRKWDGWPPHLGHKCLVIRRKYFRAYCEAPKKVPRTSGFLGTSPDAHGSKVRGHRVRPFCHHDVAHYSFRRTTRPVSLRQFVHLLYVVV